MTNRIHTAAAEVVTNPKSWPERPEFPATQSDAPRKPDDNWDATDLAVSVVALTTRVQAVGDFSTWKRQILSLLRWRAPVQRAHRFRINMRPVINVQGGSMAPYNPATEFPIGNPSPVFPSVPLPTEMSSGAWVRLKWGVGGASQNELVAPYPRWGSAFDVTADQVELDIFFDFTAGPTPPFSPELLPVFGADMGPCNAIEATSFGLAYSRIYLVPAPTAGASFITIPVPPFARTVEFDEQLQPVPGGGAQYVRRSWVDADSLRVGFADRNQYARIPGNAAALLLENTDVADREISVQWRISP